MTLVTNAALNYAIAGKNRNQQTVLVGQKLERKFTHGISPVIMNWTNKAGRETVSEE